MIFTFNIDHLAIVTSVEDVTKSLNIIPNLESIIIVMESIARSRNIRSGVSNEILFTIRSNSGHPNVVIIPHIFSSGRRIKLLIHGKRRHVQHFKFFRHLLSQLGLAHAMSSFYHYQLGILIKSIISYTFNKNIAGTCYYHTHTYIPESGFVNGLPEPIISPGFVRKWFGLFDVFPELFGRDSPTGDRRCTIVRRKKKCH